MSVKFAHIAPVSYLPLVRWHSTHLLLAHLVEENEDYRNFYVSLKKENPNVFYHLDNSAFEMFKRGQPMYDSSKLLKMAEIVQANSIVMSDYPKEHWEKTVASADKLIPQFKDAGFDTFFCPQSELGDLDGLMSGFKWGLENDNVDYIGVSILNCPIGLGINETKHGSGTRNDAYRMQRYLSRWAIFNELKTRDLLPDAYKRFHCLGMTDGPKEITLLEEFHDYIFSWDSSSAIWHGICGIQYDQSPTGLINGKHEEEVNFDYAPVDDFESFVRISYNMNMIDKMCRGD